MSDDTTAGTKRISVESAEAVLGLHWFVAQDEGLFAELAGLDRGATGKPSTGVGAAALSIAPPLLEVLAK